MQADIKHFFHAPTNTFTYVVADPVTRRAAVIDPVLDYTAASGRIATQAADTVLEYLHDAGLTLEWILETHAHADHVTAAQYLKTRAGGRVAIGEGIREVQGTFKRLFNLEADFPTDGSQFDHLFGNNESFRIGSLEVQVLHVPGHTSDSVAYLVDDAVFVGDTLFMPDSGTARCDFPGGDARTLYASIRRLLDLPPDTRLFMCHDYGPGGREIRNMTTVAEERAGNIHVRDGVTEEEFVALRTARDRTLGVPALLIPAIQINIRAGHLPPPEANGTVYLKVPVNLF